MSFPWVISTDASNNSKRPVHVCCALTPVETYGNVALLGKPSPGKPVRPKKEKGKMGRDSEAGMMDVRDLVTHLGLLECEEPPLAQRNLQVAVVRVLAADPGRCSKSLSRSTFQGNQLFSWSLDKYQNMAAQQTAEFLFVPLPHSPYPLITLLLAGLSIHNWTFPLLSPVGVTDNAASMFFGARIGGEQQGEETNVSTERKRRSSWPLLPLCASLVLVAGTVCISDQADQRQQQMNRQICQHPSAWLSPVAVDIRLFLFLFCEEIQKKQRYLTTHRINVDQEAAIGPRCNGILMQQLQGYFSSHSCAKNGGSSVQREAFCFHADAQRVIFNVVNFSKTKSLYRDGMAPVVKSTSRPKW
ncbi:unnamed protein product [Tetraodon nigroviridis]|uniref:(spotted green pufferfish) hypothetical protein n=1 Tax=Tetraodon nigroviridis TaxID=99883 RepID=Q4RUF4_TETNG|nr:unnamed protein product [Tetraodon nigroviridis]